MKVYNAKVEETYRHLETGEIFKTRKDWEAKGFKAEEMAYDRDWETFSYIYFH